MSVTTATDPVETIKDILDATTAGDWPNAGKPTHIEFQWEVSQKTKGNRTDDALYLYSPAEGTIESLGAGFDAYEDGQVVNVDIWTPTSAAQAATIAGDLREIFLPEYTPDNKGKTGWLEIRPETENDIRGEKIPQKGDHFRIVTLLRLISDREPS